MKLTRRAWLAASGLAYAASAPLEIPVCLIEDSRATFEKERIAAFWRSIWPQAIRNLGYCGIRLQARRVAGEVKRLPSGRPAFAGLERGMLNVVVTNQIPLAWDNGRGLNGVTWTGVVFSPCI